MSCSLVEVVEHYQNCIEKSQNDVKRLLHCIDKLNRLPIKFEHLQQTGIGKTINSLRKYNGEIGIAAKALVTKWKAMVASEDLPTNENNENEVESRPEESENNSKTKENDKQHTADVNSSTSKSERAGGGGDKLSRHDRHATKKTEQSTERRVEKTEKEVDRNSHKRSKESSSRHHHHHQNNVSVKQNGHRSSRESSMKKPSSSSASSSKEILDNQKSLSSSSSSSHNHRNKESSHHKSSHSHHKKSKRNDEKTTSSSSSTIKLKSERHRQRSMSPQPSTSAAAAAARENDAHRRHKSPQSSSPHSPDTTSSPKIKVSKSEISKSAKKRKTKDMNSDDEDQDDGIDSSMGANFEDVLGMLNVPSSKKLKKSLNITNACGSSSSTSSSKVNSLSASTAGSDSKSSFRDQASCSNTQPSLKKKPDLLSSKVKLEPLDPNIALELPTISTNYKPMPLNKTVMDCVFNNNNNNGTFKVTPSARSMNEVEALSHGISSKTMRTKIYSGVRSGQIFQVPSLFDLCIRVLQKNMDALEYTGGVPFDLLRPVIERATPQQLFTFEEYNPYILDDSDCLWKKHVERNFRGQKRNEMETWREMFFRCQEDQERKLNSLAENIKRSQFVAAAPVRKTQLAFVDSMVKPPRSVQRKQEIYGTKAKLTATPAARVAALSSVTPNAAKVGDARLRAIAATRDTAQIAVAPIRPKKAPLMAKTLQFMRGRLKR